MDALNRAEDELLGVVHEAEQLVTALRDLPSEEKRAQQAATSLLAKLARAQQLVLDSLGGGEAVKDFAVFERHAGPSRQRMRQARSDRLAAKSSLEITLEQFHDDAAVRARRGGGGGGGGEGGGGEGQGGEGDEEEDEEEEEEEEEDVAFMPSDKGIKRLRGRDF